MIVSICSFLSAYSCNLALNASFTSSRLGRCEWGLVKLNPHSQYIQLKLHSLLSSGNRLTPSDVPKRLLLTGPNIILLNNIIFCGILYRYILVTKLMFLILLANNMFVIVQLCNHMETKKGGKTHKVRLHNPYDFALMLFVYQMFVLGFAQTHLLFSRKNSRSAKNKQVCFCSHLIVLLS